MFYSATDTVTNITAGSEWKCRVIQLKSLQTGNSNPSGVCPSVIPRPGGGEGLVGEGGGGVGGGGAMGGGGGGREGGGGGKSGRLGGWPTQ